MLSNRRVDLLTIYTIVYFMFLYGPVLLLPVFSVNDSIYIAFPLKGFTLASYRSMLGNDDLIQALRASVEVGVSVAIISTVLGLMAAKAVTRPSLPGRQLFTGLIVLPLIFPPLVMAMALLFLLRHVLSLDLSLYTIAAGHVLLCLPFAMLIMVARLEGFDRSLEEASLDLGEGAWRTFWRVTIPLAWPGIVSSLLLCFSASFDEYVFASFLSGDRATLPLFIFSQLRFPQLLPGVLALSTCILAGSVVLVIVSEVIRRLGIPTETPLVS